MSQPTKGGPSPPRLKSPPPPKDTDVSPRPLFTQRVHQASTTVRDSPVRERVSFFEQHVDKKRVVTPGTSRENLLLDSSLDETRRTRTVQEIGHPRTPGTVFRESYESITEEGASEDGVKVVRVDRVTLTKTVRETSKGSVHSSNSSIASPLKERSPGPDEQDSAYRTRGMSKSSSISSLVSSWGTGRYTSQESLLGSPADAPSDRSRTTEESSSNSDYRHQPFQTIAARMKQIRSKAEYDSHIAEIKGELRVPLFKKKYIYGVLNHYK
ncbi:Hypothetical predicted protein [Cloeon dipterum]|uniref:Uncharacterized protein n=1 Tax=Cloeon dipterum TaxID=197152 RepID=A0A8S1CRI8_9INSE|nr:Hypothetical predicted protein [Cloeon dipterum]